MSKTHSIALIVMAGMAGHTEETSFDIPRER